MLAVILKHKFKFLLALIALVQINTLNNEFAFDDHPAILENHYIQQGWSGVPEMLQYPYWHGVRAFKADIDENYIHYRPVIQLLHATEYQLFAKRGMPYHLVSLLIFLGLLLLIIRFLQLMGLSENAIIITVLLFGLTPIHTEVVANIKSQDELLASALMIATLVQFLKWLDSKAVQHMIFAMLFFILAVFTKEATITVVGVMAMILIYRQPGWTRSLLSLSGFGAIVVIMLLVRNAILPASPNLSNIYFFELSFIERLPSSLKVLSQYVIKTLVPWPLMHTYDQNQMSRITWQSTETYVHLLVWLFVGWALMRGLFKRQEWVLWTGFFIITISVATHIIMPISIPFAERLVFLPSLGIYALIGWWLARQTKIAAKPMVIGLGVVAILYSTGTIIRNAEWKTSITLFEADLHKAKENFVPTGNLAYAYFDHALEQKNKQAAQPWLVKSGKLLDQSIAIGGGKFDFLLRRGIIHYELDELDQSIYHLKQALAMMDMPAGHFYLARSAVKSGELELAERELILFEKNLGTFTKDDLVKPYYLLGKSYVAKGNYEKGLAHYNKALNIRQCVEDAYLSIGLMYNEMGQPLKAIKSFEKDLKCRPGSPAKQYIQLLKSQQ